MKVSEIQNLFKSSLDELYHKDESSAITRTALMEVLNFTSSDLVLNQHMEVSPGAQHHLLEILQRLKQSEPLQHVLGYVWFCALKLNVNRHVLIPRSETEELVEWLIKENEMDFPHILDIGTGSGCIAIALAKQIKDAEITAMDISPEAIETAKQNAVLNNVPVKFVENNILNPIDNNEPFDIIVSNPPYVLQSESKTMDKHVLEFEPPNALFVPDNDPLLFYRAIVKYAEKNLKAGGKIFFEINPYKDKEIVSLLSGAGFEDIILKKDLHGKDRMVKGIKT